MTAVMLQGTGSNVGKSTLVAGLCRALYHRGLTVRPFKPQNMSNNAAVTVNGGEIGRAQALQSLACGIDPTEDMNPILLKPQAGGEVQLVVRGHAYFGKDAVPSKKDLLDIAVECFEKLKQQADIVIVEGAGSAAEVNLRDGDIANMGFALKTETPVVMIGDIDLGGVIASLVGTHILLSQKEQNLVKGFIINKFRGNISLFQSGIDAIKERTKWPSLGTIPYLPLALNLPAEDAVFLEKNFEESGGELIVVVPHLPHIANFDDLDPLRLEERVQVKIIQPGGPLPGDASLVIIPGSKSTLQDLAFFKKQGWDIDLAAHIRRGGHVLGICGGFQMLGQEVADPSGVEGITGSIEGLGHLEVKTTMAPEKQVGRVRAHSHMMSCSVEGYEIHIGTTEGTDMSSEFIEQKGRAMGACSQDGRILGTYIHGLFSDDKFRSCFLSRLKSLKLGTWNYRGRIEECLDLLAEEVEKNVDVDSLLKLAR